MDEAWLHPDVLDGAGFSGPGLLFRKRGAEDRSDQVNEREARRQGFSVSNKKSVLWYNLP